MFLKNFKIMIACIVLSAVISSAALSQIFVHNNCPLKQGDLLVYRIWGEEQNIKGDAEIFNKYIDEKVLVKRSRSQRTEKVPAEDHGLKYGSPLRVGLKLDQDPLRSDNMYCNYVETKEDVTVPAGTFKSCFKVVHCRMKLQNGIAQA